VEVAGAAQGLSGVCGPALAHVMDDEDGEVVMALQVPEEGEQFGDIPCVVLIAPVKPDQGVEEDQARPDAAGGAVEAQLIALEIEAQRGCGDDVEGDVIESEAPVEAQAGEAFPERGGVIFGEIDEHVSGVADMEAAETRGGGGDREGQIETEPGLAELGAAGEEADGGAAPEGLDEPAGVFVRLVELPHAADGKQLILVWRRLPAHSWTGMRTSSTASSRMCSSTKL